MKTSFSTNLIILQGNISNEPVVKTTNNGTLILTFSMATNRSVKNGEKYEDKSTYHRIVCIGKGAEWLQDRLRKGMKVFVLGRQENRSYEKDGQKFYVSEVIANEITPVLPTTKKTTDTGAETSPSQTTSYIDSDEDIPF